MTVIAVNFFAASSRQLKSTETEESGGKLEKILESVHIQITGKTESESPSTLHFERLLQISETELKKLF